MKIFISGRPGVGKTTLVKKISDLLKHRGVRFGGFITLEIREKGKRVGFQIVDILKGRKEIFASIYFKGTKVGKYGIDVKSFEKIAIPAVEDGIRYKFLLIDEIGRMEMESFWFKKMIKEVVKSDINLVASLHRNYIDKFKRYGEVYVITLENREMVFNKIKTKLKEFFI